MRSIVRPCTIDPITNHLLSMTKREKKPLTRLCITKVLELTNILNSLSKTLKPMNSFISNYGPIAVIFTGAILSAIGALWAHFDSDKQSREILRLNTEITATVTGGDSYPEVNPVFVAKHGEQGDIRKYILHHVGKFPVYDLVVVINDIDAMRDELKKESQFIRQDAYLWKNHIGTIGKGYEQILFEIPNWDRDQLNYQFSFWARNGNVNQRIIHKKIEGKWITGRRITKDGKVLSEKIDPNLPPELVEELKNDKIL